MNGSVLHVVISLAPGGLERLVVDWANVRNRRRPGSTAICCLDEPGELADAVQGAEVVCLRASRNRFPFDWMAAMRLRGLVRRSSFGVVHSHNLAALQYSTLALAGMPVRHIHTEHGSNPHAEGLFGRMRGRWLYGRADAVVAVSEDTRRAVETAFGLRHGHVHVIRNGVAIADGIPAGTDRVGLRQALGIPSDACVVGSVGRLAEVKGYDRLVRAFAGMAGSVSSVECRVHSGGAEDAEVGWQRSEVGGRRSEVRGQRSEVRGQRSVETTPRHSDTPPLFLLLIGDGPERAVLEALASRLGVANRVVFAGFRADARRLLGAMDLFVLPSRSEGLSVSLLEAMAEGVPVAVTDAGANLEVIENGTAGVVLPADEAKWPQIIEQAARSKDAGRVERAAERVRERYSIDQTVAAYEALYSQ